MEIITKYVCLFILSENVAINHRYIHYEDNILVFLKFYGYLVIHKCFKLTNIFTFVMTHMNYLILDFSQE